MCIILFIIIIYVDPARISALQHNIQYYKYADTTQTEIARSIHAIIAPAQCIHMYL